MPEKGQKSRLQDVLNYQTEGYFTPEEIAVIQSTFNNPKVIAILRKALLPSVGDLSLPIEEALGQDVWLAGYQWQQIPAEEAKILATARQDSIKFIIGGLIKLKVIAHTAPDSDIEAAFKRSKDSAK